MLVELRSLRDAVAEPLFTGWAYTGGRDRREGGGGAVI